MGPCGDEHTATPAGFPTRSPSRRPAPREGSCPELHGTINVLAPEAGMSGQLQVNINPDTEPHPEMTTQLKSLGP